MHNTFSHEIEVFVHAKLSGGECEGILLSCLICSHSQQVAVEAMDKKTKDMAIVVKMDPPDLKRLQLLLAGSISTQVNQGIQEYVAFFKDSAHLPPDHVEQLRHMYRSVH